MRLCILITALAFLPITTYASETEKKLYDDYLSSVRVCSEQLSTGQSKVSCWVNAAPERCETIVLDMFYDRANRREYRRKLYACIATCSDAGFISKTFGSCSSNF